MFFRYSRQWKAWGASCTLHGLVLLCLAMIVFRRPADVGMPFIETRIEPAVSTSEPFTPPLDMKGILGTTEELSGGPTANELLGPGPSGLGLGTSGTDGPLAFAGGLGVGGPGEGGLMGGEKGMGFFGTRGSGKSVVFVVDMSGSMDGFRFARAQQELVRAIYQLHVTQKFYVIFFNKHAIPMFSPRPPRGLVMATPTMKRSVTRWIVDRRPAAGTEPEDSLVMALNLKPDVIYFLTDGEFPERCREVCKEKNTHGSIIHTIALQSREGAPLLRDIAEDHKGTFKFVK